MGKESKFSLKKKINKKIHELKFVCINRSEIVTHSLVKKLIFLKKFTVKTEIKVLV